MFSRSRASSSLPARKGETIAVIAPLNMTSRLYLLRFSISPSPGTPGDGGVRVLLRSQASDIRRRTLTLTLSRSTARGDKRSTGRGDKSAARGEVFANGRGKSVLKRVGDE